jgi:hypothetical protein
VNALDRHAENVMARVRGVLGAHAPDLLLAFEGLVLMDSLTEEQPAEVPIIPLETEPPPINLTPVEVPTLTIDCQADKGTSGRPLPIDPPMPRVDPPIHVEPATVDGKPKTFRNVCRICAKEFESPFPGARYCSDDCRNREPVDTKPPEVPAILQRPVVPPREHVGTVSECSVDVDGKSVEELIAGAPNLSSPHDPEKMVQLVRSMIDDPTGTNSGPFVAKFLCVPVQGTHWVLRWIRYHAEVLPALKNYQKAEYLQKLLLDRQRVKREAA